MKNLKNICSFQVFNTYDLALPCIYSSLYNKEYYIDIRSQFMEIIQKTIFTRVDHLKIPKIIHLTWMTDLINPSPYKEILKENVVNMIALLPDFEFYFWSNLNYEFTKCIDIECKIHMMDISQLNLLPNFINLINNFLDLKIFVGAADIIKLLVLESYGGIVLDGDYKFYNSPIDFHYIFDFYAAAHENKTFGGSYLAAKPQHPIVKKALEIVSINYGLTVKKDSDLDLLYLPSYISCHGLIEYTLQGSIDLGFYHKNNIETVDVLFHSYIIHDGYLYNSQLADATSDTILSEELVINLHFNDGSELKYDKLLGKQSYSGLWRENCDEYRFLHLNNGHYDQDNKIISDNYEVYMPILAFL